MKPASRSVTIRTYSSATGPPLQDKSGETSSPSQVNLLGMEDPAANAELVRRMLAAAGTSGF